MTPKTVEFCGELQGETPKCWFVFDGIHTVPIPKSQVVVMRMQPNNVDCIIELPEWLAKKKDII